VSRQPHRIVRRVSANEALAREEITGRSDGNLDVTKSAARDFGN
jgi:hypothetical protein